MIISKLPDNDGGKGESVAVPEAESDSHEYQTANELFEIMAKNQHFDTTDVEKLSTRDLVLLYKNIDLGTKLMSNANELKRTKPNQHVESIVYNDDPESDGSEVEEMYSNEDLRNIFMINNERLDLLNPPSVENTLCHKLGDLEIQTSNLTAEYDKHFLFKDPYIKEQLKSLKLMNKSSDFEGAVLPASLLDYICCKRLEDNYNFYMDNIIRYVKNTIDQLKRISNGDYLTDKAKEKWREVENTAEDLHANTKVLASSASMPLHVERKSSGRNTTWDDIVHSTLDIRSLSKILEKKIVVEVPKLLCGPYKLLSQCCAENLIISCKKDKQPVEERVDVVFKLERSETGQVISNINSIMILQSAPVERDTLGPEVLPLPLSYIEQTNNKHTPESKPKIIELESIPNNETIHDTSDNSVCSTVSSDNPNQDSFLDSIDYGCSDNDITTSLKNSGYQVSSDSSDALKDILDQKIKNAQPEASCDVFPDDLLITIRKLPMQSALTEESGEEMSQTTSKKKKSPTRVRIKSPYENQSFIMEEKKRRKLLEIRERRERKKMALAENCKISKHKYVKGSGALPPQSASSVTKLSISNKSFYNSIYGQSSNLDDKQGKGRNRKGGKRDVLGINMDEEGDNDVSVVSAVSDKNSKKYTNRSYYLDDADTEMMYISMKQNENDAKDLCSTSTSVMSNEFRNNLTYLSQLIGPSESDLNIDDDVTFPDKIKLLPATKVDDIEDESASKEVVESPNIIDKVPSNTPHEDEQDNTDSKKPTSVECRKSIEDIYTLMNKLGQVQETAPKSTKGKFVTTLPKKVDEKDGRTNSTCQGSESGTSLKHRITSSNPSSFSFDKTNTDKPNSNRKPGTLSPVVPKVIISAKPSPIPKIDLENNRKHRRRSGISPPKIQENPLKAISQLLHEFENVQKKREKPNAEQKRAKKNDTTPSEVKGVSRKPLIKRRSRLDKHNELETEGYTTLSSPKEKKSTQHKDIDLQKKPVDDKHTEKPTKKKIIDMLDEAKEARGEAVRGPSKYNSRLNSLAQPKRTYVQAHSEEYQTKYGKTLMSHRLQKLATAPPHHLDRPAGSGNTKNKLKRSGSEAVPAVGALERPLPPSDRAFRTRFSPSSSPETKKRLDHVMGSSYKQLNVPETPQALKKKMVAVESYVKNHYGRSRPATPVSNDLQSAQKSRVPLLPNDIELASSTSSAPFQESTELGSKLHNIINSIMKTASPGLEVLPECHECTSVAENISSTERRSTGSDYVLDILNDNNVITSVETADQGTAKEQQQNLEETGACQTALQPVRSIAELEKLENALCNHFPVGTFQKRLRIKNLTMTPKQSMHQVFVLQSGDAGSLVVQTPIARNMKDKVAETCSDLTILPILSKSHLDWRFGSFPMQISTVGYAFPDYKSIQRNSNSLIQLFKEGLKYSDEEKPLPNNHKDDEVSDTVNDAQPLRFEQAAQVDLLPATTLVNLGGNSTCTVIQSGKEQEIKYCDPTNAVLVKKVEDTTNGEQTKNNTVLEKNENVSEAHKPNDVEYTTSLDILVGLLNEIQNITTRQTQMTKGDKTPSENQQNKVLETLLINEAAALETSVKSSDCDVVSLSSLDRLRQLESHTSLYSFYLSDNERSEKGTSKLDFSPEIIPNYTNELWCSKPIYADKEVGVDIIGKEVVSKFTDVASQILPPGISHSTNMTNSLIRVLSEPSIHSMFFTECPSVDSNAVSLGHKSIINIPHVIITRESKQSLDAYNVNNQIVERANKNKTTKKILESFEMERIKNMKNINNGKFCFKTEFDPIMKMKRDILVTMYSILVFTVFAALSFPEMYRI